MPETKHVPPRVEAIVMDLVSHELRSPLTAIRGYAETLLRRVGQLPLEDQEEFLSAILQSTKRLEYRLDQMLELAELRAGRMSPLFEVVDLAHVAWMVCASLGVKPAISFEVPAEAPVDLPAADHVALPANASTVEVGASATPTLALNFAQDRSGDGSMSGDSRAYPVVGDERRLHGVLLHVVQNALRHSPPGGVVKVHMRSVARDEALSEAASRGVLDLENSLSFDAHSTEPKVTPARPSPLTFAPFAIEVGVHDTGAGIAPEHLARIFEPFYQVDQMLSRSVEGLGLGLPICREVIHLHGGVMWAESVLGRGSSFRFLLPRRDEEKSAVPLSTVTPRRRKRSPGSTRVT